VDAIITLALPVLMLIYPLTIVLIILNVLPRRFKTPIIMRLVVLFTAIFSIPDVLKFIIPEATWLPHIQNIILFSEYGLGWVLPAVLAFIIGLFLSLIKQ